MTYYFYKGMLCAQDLHMEPEQLAEKAATLRAIYEQRYAFPEWTVQELGRGNLVKHAETAAWPGWLGIGHRVSMSCDWNGYEENLNLFMNINWRVRPAPPVIPAPITHIKVARLKTS